MSGEEFMSGPALYIMYVLFAVAAIGAIVGPIITSLSDPKALIKPAIAVVVLLILFGIGYSMAGDETYVVKNGTDEITIGSDISKKVGGALTMLYILGFIAVASVVFNEVSKIFK